MNFEILRSEKHVVACGDVCDPIHLAAFSDLISPLFKNPHIIYCDPPWNSGITTLFARKAGIQNRTFEKTIECFLLAIQKFACPAFVEMGVKETPMFMKFAKTVLDVEALQVPITYASKTECRLIYLNPNNSTQDYPWALKAGEGSDDRRTPRLVMESIATSGLVIDICIGQGTTLKCAERCGWRCAGLELCRDRALKSAELFL
jgi:hypothetical protein